MSNDDSSDVGSKMDVSFDVNVMTDADDGGVAYLLDSYFPDNTGILERDPLNAAVRAADSTSILKLHSITMVLCGGRSYNGRGGLFWDCTASLRRAVIYTVLFRKSMDMVCHPV